MEFVTEIPINNQSTINQPTRIMNWIERHRLEISIQRTAMDAKQQLQHLKGKDKKALQSEFKEWLDAEEKLEIERTEFWDYNGYY